MTQFHDLILTPEGTAALGRALIPWFVFALTGAGLISHSKWLRDSFPETLDRLILGAVVGAAAQTVALMIIEGVFTIPVAPATCYTLMALALGSGLVRNKLAVFGRPGLWQLAILVALLALLGYGLESRFVDTLKHPDVLLDADPYRHHAWTRHILQTGEIPAFAPLMVGNQPEFGFQFNYILAAVLGQLGGFTAWECWKYGSLTLGGYAGVFGGYLLGKYGLGRNSVAGLFGALILSTVPVHILRTKLGFAETYAQPFLGPAILFYFRFLRSEHKHDALIWGLLFTTMIGANMPNGVFLTPFFAAVLVVTQLLRRRLQKQAGEPQTWSLLPGSLLSLAVFVVTFIFWKLVLFPVSLYAGLSATGSEGTQQMADQKFDLAREITRNLGWNAIGFGIAGLVILLSLKLLKKDRALEWLAPVESDEEVLLPGRYWTTFGALATMAVWYIALMAITRTGIIGTFTPRYHRYMMAPAHGYAILGAIPPTFLTWLLWRPLRERLQGIAGIAVAVVLSLAIMGGGVWTFILRDGVGKAWGGWGLTFTPSEYAAARWLRDNTEPDDIVAANWYTCDLIRAIAERRTIASTYLRTNFRHLAKKDPDLDLRALSSEAEIREFAEPLLEEGRNVWVVKDKWGPSLRLLPSEGFFEVEEFGGESDKSTIYRVGEPKLDPLPPPKPGERVNLARGALVEVGAVKGTVLRGGAINDGTLGRNLDQDVATTDPRSESPVEAWFGVKLREKSVVTEVKATTGWYRDPASKERDALMYTAYRSQIEYLDESGEWTPIPGTLIEKGDSPYLRHKFDPVTTERIRLRIFEARDWLGRVSGDLFRTTCLELEVYGPEERKPAAAATVSASEAAAAASPTGSSSSAEASPAAAPSGP